MGSRHRTVLAGAVLAGVVLLGASAAVAQDPGSITTTTAVTATTVAGAAGGPETVTTGVTEETNQTVVEAPEPTETPLFTESRKIMAIIAALVVVALLLALLTARYVRKTKPYYVRGSATVDDAEPVVADEAAAAEPAPELAPVVPGVDPVPSVEVPIAEPASADHHGADHDWEPRTGEHQRIDPPRAGVVRPGAAARRAVLGGAGMPGAPVASGDG